MRTTHTYAILHVSPTCYEEIRERLAEAGYQHAFHHTPGEPEVIDMAGIALQVLPHDMVRELDPNMVKMPPAH